MTPEQLVHVESFIGVNVGVFTPSTGHCFYAISEDHVHPSFSFYYSYGNKIKMSKNGYISTLPPDIKHHEIPSESFIRYFAILIDPEFFLNHSALYKKKITPDMLEYIKLPEQLIPSVKNFMAETSIAAEGSDEIIRSLEIQIVHHLLRAIFSINVNTGIITERADIDYAVEYINDNYANQVTLEDLAGKIALSKSHFSHVFKKKQDIRCRTIL